MLLGNLAWVGLGKGLLDIPAELLLALHSHLVLHPSLHLLEAWMDNLLLQAEQGIHQLGEGSLQLEQGNHPPGVDNPLLLVGNHLPGVGIRLPVGGSLLLQVDSHLLQGGSHLLQEGSHLLLVDSHLLGEDMPLVEAGSLPPVVGILQTEEGILGSSSSKLGRCGRQIQEEPGRQRPA